MGERFFPGDLDGGAAVMRQVRGYEGGSGNGLVLPSDLVADDDQASKYGHEPQLWLSRAAGSFYILEFNVSNSEWLGCKLKAKSLATARIEMLEINVQRACLNVESAGSI